MIRLHPLPDVDHHCPFDTTRLLVVGWHIPGMRNLADLRCPTCGREYFGDLPAGHGRYYPMLLDKKTGDVHDPRSIAWFADWLRQSYAHRSDEPLGWETEEFRPLRTPLLLNCLDTLYGHCLLKLLNAQYYLDKRPEFDLVVLVPRFLRWLVPAGVAAIWTVDLPLRRGTEWNDWLAAAISTRLEKYRDVWLSIAYSHPHPQDVAIERFTRVQPFPVDQWPERLQRPAITFIWREDRLWGEQGTLGRLRRWVTASGVKLGARGMCLPRQEQLRRLGLLATGLRQAFPALDFAVAGFGTPGGLPHWIEDLRTTALDPAGEKAWCDRYALSHVVLGIHGSNMLLPSALAGATIELMPTERWGNVIQDLLLPDLDCRETLLRYRVVPSSISVQELAAIIVSFLRSYDSLKRDFTDRHIDPAPDRLAEMPRRRSAG